MVEAALLSITLLCLTICLIDWRKGIYISVLVGFAQDPIRKLLPGEPVYMVALVAVFVSATMVGAWLQGVPLSYKPIHKKSPLLKTPLAVFISIVIFQAFMAFVRTGSVILTGIGLLAYLTPLAVIPLAFQFARDETEIDRFIRFYLVCSLLTMSGVFISFSGADWQIMKQVGVGIVAYSSEGGRLTLHSGFMRSPEIAAWHAATAASLLILLYVYRRRNISVLSWAGLILFLLSITAIILTGRRKMLAEIVLFLSLFGFLLFRFRRGASRLAFMVLGLGLIGLFFGNTYLWQEHYLRDLLPYYQRGASVGGDATERLWHMTFQSFHWVILRNGVFGSGAGTASQGAQHFGGGAKIVGGSAEGGIGKVLAELGIPGLLVVFFLIYRVVKYLWLIIKTANPVKSGLPRLAIGIISFLAANVLVFVTAAQVFGDIFVLLIVGLLLGFVFAIPKFAEKSLETIPPR